QSGPSWPPRGRLRSEAPFANLAGAAPTPASSGQTTRHRLDRSGDRQLNRALHQIILTRRRMHRPTVDYIERRVREGKSRREATRCLKRYLARNLYRLLEHPPSNGLTNIEASPHVLCTESTHPERGKFAAETSGVSRADTRRRRGRTPTAQRTQPRSRRPPTARALRHSHPDLPRPQRATQCCQPGLPTPLSSSTRET